MLNFNPSFNASNSAILLVTLPNGLARFNIQSPFSDLTIQPNHAFPGFPLEVPSKFNFFHLIRGATHLHSFLAIVSFLG